MAKPKIDPRPFTLRSDILNLLAAQAFADLTNEHNARVFLSNLVPSGTIGPTQDIACNANCISFDYTPQQLPRSLRRLLGIEPELWRNGTLVTPGNEDDFNDDDTSLLRAVYKLSDTHRLEIQTHFGAVHKDKYLLLYTEN